MPSGPYYLFDSQKNKYKYEQKRKVLKQDMSVDDKIIVWLYQKKLWIKKYWKYNTTNSNENPVHWNQIPCVTTFDNLSSHNISGCLSLSVEDCFMISDVMQK